MDTETDYLQSIAEEIVVNNMTETAKPNHHLKREAKRLEQAIINHLITTEVLTRRHIFHFSTLSKLVHICDTLFDLQESITPDIRTLIELFTNIKQILPGEIKPNVKLPKALVLMQKVTLQASWEQQKALMEANGIDKKLIVIAAIPFLRFINPHQPLYWHDLTWLRGYQAKLTIMDWENADCNSKTEAMMSLLIAREFNDDRFYLYCKKYIRDRAAKITGKRKRLLEYAACEKLVLQDTQTGMASFDTRANSLSARLVKWIRKEIDFVKTHEQEKPFAKFEFKWNVEMIAFFFKLLYDHKALGKVTLEKLSEQIAANCSSVGREELTAGSIFSKFYVKEPEITVPMEKLLNELLTDVRKFLG